MGRPARTVNYLNPKLTECSRDKDTVDPIRMQRCAVVQFLAPPPWDDGDLDRSGGRWPGAVGSLGAGARLHSGEITRIILPTAGLECVACLSSDVCNMCASTTKFYESMCTHHGFEKKIKSGGPAGSGPAAARKSCACPSTPIPRPAQLYMSCVYSVYFIEACRCACWRLQRTPIESPLWFNALQHAVTTRRQRMPSTILNHKCIN